MLEQFADGDGSFRSDCSLVKKVLKPKGSTGLSPMIKSQISEQPAVAHAATVVDSDAIPSISDVEEDPNADR